MIERTPYKVVSYKKKTETKDEIEIDVSTLTIENTQTGQQIVLVANKEANDPTSFGEFLYTWHPPDHQDLRSKRMMSLRYLLRPAESTNSLRFQRRRP
jgi:hypothetical protein